MNKVELVNQLYADAVEKGHRWFSSDYVHWRYGLFTVTFDERKDTATIMWHNDKLATIKNPTASSIVAKLDSFYSKFRSEFGDSDSTKQYILDIYRESPSKSVISLTKLLGRFSSLASVGYALSRLNMDKNKDIDDYDGSKVTLKLITAVKGVPLEDRVYAYSIPPIDGMYYGSFTLKPSIFAERSNSYSVPRLPFSRDNAPREAGHDWEEFPFPIAELVRKKYPKLWSKAGTGGTGPTRTAFTGDDAYALYARWVSGDRSPDVLDWRHNRRYNYGSRHQHDFRWRGVIAAIKWGMVLPIGIEAMLRELERKGG